MALYATYATCKGLHRAATKLRLQLIGPILLHVDVVLHLRLVLRLFRMQSIGSAQAEERAALKVLRRETKDTWSRLASIAHVGLPPCH